MLMKEKTRMSAKNQGGEVTESIAPATQGYKKEAALPCPGMTQGRAVIFVLDKNSIAF